MFYSRLSACDLTYGPEAGGQPVTADNFLPSYRTFKIHPLSSNTSYWVYMVCRDKEGGWHASYTLNFTTGKMETHKALKDVIISSSSGMPVQDEPQLAAIYSPDLKEENVQTGRLNRGMLSIRPSKGVSPHIVMGK